VTAAPLPQELVEFLRLPNPAVIATIRPDGSPVSVATWYDWDDGRVLVNMDGSRRRLEHLRRDPRVALTVLGNDDWGRHVSLRGRVERLERDEGLRDIDRLARRYGGVPFRNRTAERQSAWIEIVAWHAWDGAGPWRPGPSG
jgi:PPOX class probable F420-dependent enzyme